MYFPVCENVYKSCSIVLFCYLSCRKVLKLLIMGKKNNLGRAIIKDRFKTGRRKGVGSYVSDVSPHV